MKRARGFVGEMLGTFILTLFGCGAVAVSVLFNAHQGLMQVALVWGVGVMLAIYVTRHLSCAHLNPAVSVAMVTSGRMNARSLPAYVVAQFVGAILAGFAIYLLFHPSIVAFEAANEIVRGSPSSVTTAKMFGEFYPNPGSGAVVSMPLAMGIEAFATFMLVLFVFALTEGCNVGRPNDNSAPVFIGLTVTSLICLTAPLTQTGMNPARDFGPRLVSWMMGWGDAAFPGEVGKGGFFWVYMLMPIVGGIVAALVFTHIVEPLMRSKTEPCECEKKKQTK
ncbi:MAG: aquaporin family protein [Kiritimatiellaeota bacterium]|nr:aquaporin family protein [Kiritimatiellota bacterium]